MIEREKVIQGLEACQVEEDGCTTLCKDNGCPYNASSTHCMTNLHKDTLALLKEPEQKYVPSIGGARDFGTVSSHWYRCGYPECGFPIDRGDIYCRHCGNPIGWEPEKEWGGKNAE